MYVLRRTRVSCAVFALVPKNDQYMWHSRRETSGNYWHTLNVIIHYDCRHQYLDLSSRCAQTMKIFSSVITIALWVCTDVSGFTIQTKSPVLASPLFMGRAAAVRAATKAKTDGRKAKINAIFGKRIIMAVKNGGGPDTEANTLLRDVIKQAKSNSVPVENIQRAIKRASEGAVGDFTESTFEACKS